jgi:hypothetical protein
MKQIEHLPAVVLCATLHEVAHVRRCFAGELAHGVRHATPRQASLGHDTILRLYNPLESFFDKSWCPSEIELVN